jgi:16S rRNA (adenine1518-N6/adenine1519-N6)-dimethyltransferase
MMAPGREGADAERTKAGAVGRRVPTSPAAMLAKYGLAASKQRGQTFLCDENVTRKVVAAAGVGPEDVVVEVGPGFGALTFQLAEVARHVIAVEIDAGIARAFREEYGTTEAISLVEGDILGFDLRTAVREWGVGSLTIVANIPYNVTSPLISHLIADRAVVARAVLMVQSEVGARIASGPGDADYSALSVVTRYHAGVRRLFTVRASCFYPRPKVDSGVIEIDFRRAVEHASDPDVFENVVRAAFGKRRKMLRQSLGTLLKDAGLTASELEGATGIDMTRRGETLDVDEFDRLAVALATAPSER